MTKAQKAALDFVRAYVAEHDGVSPSLREIASGLGQGSLGDTYRLIACLIERGHLRHEGGRKRALVLADSSEFERGRRFERERILGAVDKIGDARVSAMARVVQ